MKLRLSNRGSSFQLAATDAGQAQKAAAEQPNRGGKRHCRSGERQAAGRQRGRSLVGEKDLRRGGAAAGDVEECLSSADHVAGDGTVVVPAAGAAGSIVIPYT